MASKRRKFSAFLQRMQMPIYLLVILAAIVIIVADRGLFYQAFMRAKPKASPAQASSSSVSAPASSAALSVNDASTLPTSVTAGEIVPFSFTIRNDGPPTQYWYKVYVKWGSGEEDVIDENVIKMSAGASQSIPESLKFETVQSGKITIEIEGTSQSITFALPRT